MSQSRRPLDKSFLVNADFFITGKNINLCRFSAVWLTVSCLPSVSMQYERIFSFPRLFYSSLLLFTRCRRVDTAVAAPCQVVDRQPVAAGKSQDAWERLFYSCWEIIRDVREDNQFLYSTHPIFTIVRNGILQLILTIDSWAAIRFFK